MSHQHGTYLGSVRTIEDVRARCYVDGDTGCWHLRAALNGQPLPRGGRTHRLYLYGRGSVSATRAAWELARGRPVPKGRRCIRTCGSYDCVRPEHIRALLYSDAQRYIVGKYCEMSPARKAQLRLIQLRRRRLTPEQLAEIRHSPESSYALAKKFGVSANTVWSVRVGRTYRDCGAGPRWVWELAA